MNQSSEEDKNLTIAVDLQNKFEFYFIGLVFTVLALSIQTASIAKGHIQYFFEIFAWFSLLLSGFSGLLKLECKSEIYEVPIYKSSEYYEWLQIYKVAYL